MIPDSFPILEFDPTTRALLEPTPVNLSETAARRVACQAEGCLVVEMEAAAFFAVAQFRGATFGQIVYGGDLVIPDGWDKRSWHTRTDDRMRLFWLAVEACCRL